MKNSLPNSFSSILQLLLGKTAVSSYLTFGANFTFGLFTLIFFIISSRFLDPEAFGWLSISLAVFAISFDVLSLGTSQTLVRFVSLALSRSRRNTACQISSAIFRLRALESAVLLLFSYPLGNFLAVSFYRNSQLTLPFSFVLALVGGGLLLDWLLNLQQAYERFASAAILTLAAAVLKLCLLFFLIFFKIPFLVWIILAYVIPPLPLWLFGLRQISRAAMTTPVSHPVISRLFHFSKWMALWGVTASLAGRVDLLLLGRLTSAYQTGIYAAAARLSAGYILIGSSFAAVLTPKLSRLISQPDKLRRMVKLIFRLVLFMTGGVVLVAVSADWLIPLLFGPEYRPAVLIFQSLSLGSIFFLLSIPANVSLLALGYSKLIGCLSLLQLLLVTGLSLMLVPLIGAPGAAVAVIVSYFAAFSLSGLYALKKIFA